MARKVTLRFAEGQIGKAVIEPDELADLLGSERFSPELMRKNLAPGVATGLAWTEAGGDVLYIETTLLPDGKGLTLTGQLGEVMQESAKIAQSYILVACGRTWAWTRSYSKSMGYTCTCARPGRRRKDGSVSGRYDDHGDDIGLH